MRSNHVDQYILGQKGHVRVMLEILNDFFTSDELQFNSALKYGLPFYMDGTKNICYLHKCKDGSLDITFWNGKALLGKFFQLEVRDRKRMASLNYLHPEEIDLKLIKLITDETRNQQKQY